MKYQTKSIKGIGVSFKIALLAITALLMPTLADAATYYVDATSGSDSGNGSSTSPWKTIAKAKVTVAAGDTVLLRSGNYGGVNFSYTDKNGLSWTSPITYKADSGSKPVFDYLNVSWGSTTTASKWYLVFDGISVVAKSGTGRVVSIADSSYLQLKNMLIQGDFTTRGVAGTTNYCVYFSTPSKSISDVWIDNCEIRDASVGIELTGTIGSNVVIRNNELHHFAASAIKPATKAGNGTIYIEGNEIYDQDVVNDAHGTGISIRNDNMVIRGNVIHNYGNTRGIRSYGAIFPTTGYCNMLIENNLVYDTINMYSVEFCDVGTNFVIRNNTFVGRPRGRTGCSYYEYALQILLATGVNGSGLKMDNNVFVGAVSVVSSVPSANINNNIIYSLIRSGSWISALTNNKIVTSSATNSSYFYPSGKFFVGGSDFDNYAFKVVDRTTGADLIDEYQLASSSPAVDICPLTTASASDMLEASRVDISGKGNDGSNYADAGCYEFGGKPSPEQPADSNFTFADAGPQSVVEDHALTFKRSATDPAGAAVTYSAANMPSGATLSGDTFTWTPTYSQSGSYTVNFTASNGTATLSQAVTITVTNANRAPVMDAIATQNATSGSMLSFNVVASDPDGDALTYSATGLPSGATFTGNTFSWIPTVTQAGSYDVLFTVSDGQLQVSRTVTIIVDAGIIVPVNNAPVLAAIGSKTVQVGSTLSFNLSATDPENDTLTYSASNLPSGATLSGQTFNWTPTTAGTYNVTFTVSDGQLSDSETVAITVTAVSTNKPPVFAVIGNKTVKERDALQFYVSATDPEGKAVTYSIKGLPTYATFTGNKFYWRPTFTQQGTYTVTFTASDGVMTSSSTITITVVNVNQPPRLYDIGPKSVNEASKLTIYAKGTDPDLTPVKFSAKGLPTGATFTTGSYGTFTWTPTRSQAGTYYVTFTISDGLLTDSETVTITVINS